MPVININDLTRNDVRTTSVFFNNNDQQESQPFQTPQQQQQFLRTTRPTQTNERAKSTALDSSRESLPHHRNSFSSDHDENGDFEHQTRASIRKYPTPAASEVNNTSVSDVEHLPAEETVDKDESIRQDGQTGQLDENARRLLLLGTIRPSKTFYRNLPEADVNHLMNYFRRMKQTQQKVTSEEINKELAAKHVEYQPKICTL